MSKNRKKTGEAVKSKARKPQFQLVAGFDRRVHEDGKVKEIQMLLDEKKCSIHPRA